jgi:hypothetical protein
MSIKEVKSLTDLGKFVKDYRSDIPEGTCDNRIADAFFAEEANENDTEIKKDYASKAKRLLGRMSKKAKALSGQARKEAWARFWDMQKFYMDHAVLKDTPLLTDKDRERFLNAGVHIKKSLKLARTHAHYLLSKGLVNKRCVIAKDPKSGMFGIFTKQPPRNADSIIEEINLNDNAAHLEITPSPYRHGDKIQKHFNALVALDHWIGASYVEVPVHAFTAWGAEEIIRTVCPEIKPENIIHVAEKGTDWENDDFPVDDTVMEVGGEDEHYANSVADMTNIWESAEQQHDMILQQLDNAISEQLAAERGEEL